MDVVVVVLLSVKVVAVEAAAVDATAVGGGDGEYGGGRIDSDHVNGRWHGPLAHEARCAELRSWKPIYSFIFHSREDSQRVTRTV